MIVLLLNIEKKAIASKKELIPYFYQNFGVKGCLEYIKASSITKFKSFKASIAFSTLQMHMA
jgi:hypothetical protein